LVAWLLADLERTKQGVDNNDYSGNYTQFPANRLDNVITVLPETPFSYEIINTGVKLEFFKIVSNALVKPCYDIPIKKRDK
jgi:hypothetical protein